jgi:23S rRNA U2552 (ribose-2'-O)-methylase RlmE/FtsJ
MAEIKERFLSFEINPGSLRDLLTQNRMASIPQPWGQKLTDIKAEVNACKQQLDDKFTKKPFSAYWRACDPFVNEKDTVAKLGDTFNVSNAWIKCYEIEKYYKMIPDQWTNPANPFIHFDNAAFPGSFLLATHHYVATQRPWLDSYSWYGSSLIAHNEFTTTQLEDKYGLYKNYPANWLMSQHNNGDVLIPANQRDFAKRLGNMVDLYTSDLGFDVSSDYNNQELIQAQANNGQILSGLLTLKPGGCLITKQYSIFEPVTVSVIYITAQFFDKLYVAKPYTSREANSEVYLVGVGFKGGPAEYLDIMFKAIVDRDAAILDKLPMDFMESVTRASLAITRNTINKITADLDRIDRAISLNWRGPINLNPVIVDYTAYEEPYIVAWYKKYYINPIDDADRLNIVDIWRQRSRV